MPEFVLDLSPFERYRPIIDDWAAFADALHRPLPTCVWTNTLRTTPQQLAEEFNAEGIRSTPLSWWPSAFRLEASTEPSQTLSYITGCCHIQEEVSMIPPLLLDPQPGQRVLDLCAAPGNKTAQIAVQMQNQGTVVANDRSRQRLYVVGSTVERLGLVNVGTTAYDAVNYPRGSGMFDRILADVPCSCEGTSRKHWGVIQQAGPSSWESLAHTQRLILEKAVQRCAVGGRIVYSTCTYAPEENEAVVDAVLRAHPERLRILPADVPGLIGSPGLTAWNGQTFLPGLAQTLRIWPHQQDTGGFFIAVLEKIAA